MAENKEKKFELRNDNFVTLCGWMINNLNLTGNELIVYAIIYQFSQDRNSWCYASQDYLAEWIGSSTRTVRTIINSLIEKKVLLKKSSKDESGSFNIYKAFREPLEGAEEISAGGCGKNCRGVRKVFPGGAENFSPDTIYEIKDNNKDNNKGDKSPASAPKKKFVKPTVEEVAAYIREKHYNVDAQRFIDYYDSNGWKVGKNPMRNWKAAVSTWEHNGYSNNSSTRNSTGCGNNNPEGFDEIFG